MEFFVIYIREAHALDGFLPKGGGDDPIVEDPTTLQERHTIARECMERLDLAPIPALVDTLDDAANRAYDAWPDRLYLVGRDGRVRYQGAPGPDGFSPEELERAIVAELAGEVVQLPTAPDPDATDDASAPANPSIEGAADAPSYRCGDELLSEDDADDYHSRLLRWWKIPSGPFVAYSTCSRRTTLRALESMRTTYDDLVRLFGVEPDPPLTVIVLRSLEQYNAFAVTEPDGEHVPPESIGYSAFHHAFPCEQWIEVGADDPSPGAACAYWDDRTPGADRWGPLAVRHAAAHAFVERIDSSPRTISAYVSARTANFDSEAFWSEKKVPLWMRYGAAMYCERFFLDDASDDPLWARRWSLDEVTRLGGLQDLPEIFECTLSWNDVARSSRLILQAGVLVAFILDGKNPAIVSKHEDVKRSLARGQGVHEAIAALETEIIAHEQDLRRFAEMR